MADESRARTICCEKYELIALTLQLVEWGVPRQSTRWRSMEGWSPSPHSKERIVARTSVAPKVGYIRYAPFESTSSLGHSIGSSVHPHHITVVRVTRTVVTQDLYLMKSGRFILQVNVNVLYTIIVRE